MNLRTITEKTEIPSILPDMKLRMKEIIRRKSIAVEKLTEDQLADAIIQALPDFTRAVSTHGQAVIYIPGQEADRLRRELTQLKEDLKPIMNYMTVLRFGSNPGPPTDPIITPFLENHPDLATGF